VRLRHDGVDSDLPISGIVAVGAEENYCRVHFRDANGPSSILVRATLSDLLDRLPSAEFVRVHRSHAVALGHVSGVARRGRALELHCGELRVPVSRSRCAEVRERLAASIPVSAACS
jgi:DNA-binding LytR/AlgR family response regulator